MSGVSGGGGGIRTHGTVSRTPVFKTGALNRSATPPRYCCHIAFRFLHARGSKRLRPASYPTSFDGASTAFCAPQSTPIGFAPGHFPQAVWGSGKPLVFSLP
jgi:hypothetical protein